MKWLCDSVGTLNLAFNWPIPNHLMVMDLLHIHMLPLLQKKMQYRLPVDFKIKINKISIKTIKMFTSSRFVKTPEFHNCFIKLNFYLPLIIKFTLFYLLICLLHILSLQSPQNKYLRGTCKCNPLLKIFPHCFLFVHFYFFYFPRVCAICSLKM